MFLWHSRDSSEGEIQYEVNVHKSHSAVCPFSFHLDVWRRPGWRGHPCQGRGLNQETQRALTAVINLYGVLYTLPTGDLHTHRHTLVCV